MQLAHVLSIVVLQSHAVSIGEHAESCRGNGDVCSVSLLQTDHVTSRDEAKQAQPKAAATAATGSPFSPSQERCISDYIDDVDAALPGGAAHLRARRWGGTGSPLTSRDPPFLGVGFGTTATRSVATFTDRVLGVRTLHYPPGRDIDFTWKKLRDTSVLPLGDKFTSRTECAKFLNGIDYSELLWKKFDMFLDTPMAEHFLDFYAVSNNSKIILTTRPALQWVDARLKYNDELNVPMLSPCGFRLADVQREVGAHLMSSYEKLVRCVVPPENLLEITVFNGTEPSGLRIADFLGKGTALGAEIPLPRLSDVRFDALKHNAKLGVCVTGQIHRLELQSKVDHLLLPALENNWTIHVALVVDSRGDTKYLHGAPGGSYLNGFHGKNDAPYATLFDTVDVFPKHVGVIYDWFVPRDIEIDRRYSLNLLADKVDRSARVHSHTIQWQALHRCWDLLQSNAFRMDYMVRVRDDLVLLSNFLPSGYVSSVVSPGCDDLNDKFFSAVGEEAIKVFSQGPLDNMRDRYDDVHNLQTMQSESGAEPESVLWNTAVLANLSVKKLPPSALSSVVVSKLYRDSSTFECFDSKWMSCLAPRVRLRIATMSGSFTVMRTDVPKRMRCLPEASSLRELV
eukprot:TRINITY_DN20639_c0_g5_i1.p1 TRINITY_DN20639_c0_g5~~TRINITY_DN20639_c0_g5_i1.p1  ORF type:complete len:645 (+),score=65.77 TRINITY_DN20639_c0_g5_i1:63-1937(+)